MPLTLPVNCPHCRVQKASFSFVHEVPHLTDQLAYPEHFTLLFSCPNCFEAVGVKIAARGGEGFARGKNGPLNQFLKGGNARFEGLYPQPAATSIPEHVSDAVARCFRQAADNAGSRNNDAAGAMYRKCLDLATKELDPSLADKNLAPRIDALHKKGLLTDALKDWAHAIRLDGNDAAHDADELKKEEVEQLASFTDLFLRYTFTLPKQVELRKADKLPD